MSSADFAVARRREVRWLRGEDVPAGKFSASLGDWEWFWELAECMDEADAEWECECRPGNGWVDEVCSPRPRFEVELAAETVELYGGDGMICCGRGLGALSSCPIHQSHNSHPKNVAKLPHPTTATEDIRSCTIPIKQTMNIITEQTCCTMTVESATRGQKS